MPLSRSKRGYAILAAVAMLVMIGVCWLVLAVRNPGSGQPQPTGVAEQIDWHEDCDEEDRRNKEWDECWAELLKQGKVKSPAPKVTVVKTGGPAPAPTKAGTTTKRRP